MKKLLLVAVSVGVFLLVTITVAIIALTPKTQVQTPAISTSNPFSDENFSVHEMLPPQPAVIAVQEPKFSLGLEDEIVKIDADNGDSLTIQIPMPFTAAVPDTSSQTMPEASTVPSVAVKTPEPAQAKPASAVSAVKTVPTVSAAKPDTSRKPAAAAKTTTAVKPAVKAINDFWVQTGAFSAQVRAEDAREILATKGITSIIENREMNGRIWYRVRLGPYTSEREANHWLEIVKLIDGFNDSQIRQTIRQN